MTIVDWIKSGLERPGKSQRGLAAALRIDAAGVSRLLKGERQLRVQEIQVVAEYLGTEPPPELGLSAFDRGGNTRGIGLGRRNGSEAAPADVSHSSGVIPIKSAARGGNEQEMFVGDVVGYTRRPGNLDGVKEAYAVYMVGDSMSPRYEHGWLLHVDPHKPSRPGRAVVLYRNDNVVLVKMLASRRAGKLELRSLIPDYPDPIEVAETDVVHCHVIVGSDEEG